MFIRPDEIRDLVSLGEDVSDLQLYVLAETASELIEAHLSRDLESKQYVQYFDGGGRYLALSAYPVSAVTKVTIEGIEVTDWKLNAKTGLLGRAVGWPTTMDGIEVSYVGGYETVPMPIQQACALIVMALKSSLDSAGQQVSSESLEGVYQIRYASNSSKDGIAALSPAAASLLSPYRGNGGLR